MLQLQVSYGDQYVVLWHTPEPSLECKPDTKCFTTVCITRLPINSVSNCVLYLVCYDFIA